MFSSVSQHLQQPDPSHYATSTQVPSDQGHSTHVKLIDFSKAFDHVDYNILLDKSNTLGTPLVLLRWLSPFLSNRQQHVSLGCEVSEWATINGGVSQGSCLGPLLFVIMVNDLSPGVECIKYMDDTTLTAEVHPGSRGTMQDCIDQTTQ